MDIILGVIGLVVGLLLGYIISRYLLKTANSKMIETAKDKVEIIIKEAELKGEEIKQERITRANEKYQQLKNKFEQNAKREKEKLDNRQNKLRQREQQMEQRDEK
ncbi:MAG: Rnase Y domain-containing protein, partial [Bacteroidota bacterium]